jgi:hypothetical protein
LNRGHAIALCAALCLSILAGAPALADRVGYNGVVDISTETDAVRAEHHHDWRQETHDARWKMISTTQNPFTADNDYSYLLLRDKSTGAEIFRRPVPALTHLWISPNSRYVVGVSHVMVWNPYQLVVFGRSGDRLLERNMVDVEWPGVRKSVTNWIYWYMEPVPRIAIVEEGATATLSVEDPMGVRRDFTFPTTRSGVINMEPRKPSQLCQPPC